jgi:hypothetical protein
MHINILNACLLNYLVARTSLYVNVRNAVIIGVVVVIIILAVCVVVGIAAVVAVVAAVVAAVAGIVVAAAAVAAVVVVVIAADVVSVDVKVAFLILMLKYGICATRIRNIKIETFFDKIIFLTSYVLYVDVNVTK